MDYLVQQGVPSDHMHYAGNSDEDPVADNANEHGRSMNRRVEITLVSE